jgi:hypothetical protein
MTMVTFDAASLSSSYQAVNSSGFPAAMNIFNILNGGSTDLTLSYDGVNAHQYVPSHANYGLASSEIASNTPDAVKIPKGTIIYIKGTAGTGTIYLTGYYLAE